MVKLNVTGTYEVPGYYCCDKCSPLFVNNYVISLLADGTTVSVWKPGTAFENRISLLGHKKTVTTLNISPSDQRYLCSCSDDKIILWDLISIQDDLQGCVPKGVTFGFDLGYVEHCAFSWNNLWLALCKEKEIWIIKIQFLTEGNNDADISHHTSLVTNSNQGNMCAFSPEQNDILVTVEDCSYFKVWNLQTMTLLYQSTSVGMHTITYCAFSNNPSRLLLGTNKGVVKVYNVRKQNAPHCVMNVNVGKSFQNNKQTPIFDETGFSPKYKSPCDQVESTQGDYGEVGCIIFGVHMFSLDSCISSENLTEAKSEEDVPGFSWDTNDILKCILSPGVVVVVCCNLGIALYDCGSWECLTKLTVSDMIPEASLTPMALSLMNFVVLGGEALSDLKCLMKTSMRKSQLHVIMLNVQGSGLKDDDMVSVKSYTAEHFTTTSIAVMSHHPITTKSPLRYQMNSLSNRSEYDPNLSLQRGCRKPNSSGYGKSPRTQMFCPIINKSRNKASQSSIKLNSKSSVNHFKHPNSNDMINSGPPMKAGTKVCLWDTSGTTIHLTASGDGNNLACSSTSSHICILKFANMNAQKSLNLIGHDGAINSLHFSLDSTWLVSGSSDSTAKVWDWRQKRCILNIDETTKYSKINGKLKQDSNLGSSVTQARFFYMDQFILMATDGCMELYSHILQETKSGIKMLQPKLGCKRIRKIELPTQKVTCFSAANQFHSYLVLCGCSNRSIQVYDLNVERFLLELQNVHVRPVHQLRQIEGSNAVSHPPAMYDLFLTAALCDSVKLWDLRSARCVQKYCQHVNRAYTNGIDISPCGRYVAVSSEDKCVYIYDTRWCVDFVGKLGGLGDIVMDVAFNPCKPLLAAAALNGYITSYSAEGV